MAKLMWLYQLTGLCTDEERSGGAVPSALCCFDLGRVASSGVLTQFCAAPDHNQPTIDQHMSYAWPKV